LHLLCSAKNRSAESERRQNWLPQGELEGRWSDGDEGRKCYKHPVAPLCRRGRRIQEGVKNLKSHKRKSAVKVGEKEGVGFRSRYGVREVVEAMCNTTKGKKESRVWDC